MNTPLKMYIRKKASTSEKNFKGIKKVIQYNIKVGWISVLAYTKTFNDDKKRIAK